ncbi:MAG TPA: hypothetical protein DCS07_14220 [Bdellovibrionales bacterium]|nr:MAG: hypothetical protein A2Z97_01130 [Bdellovibrionales bacterium GWB1_52_6]OFZ05425.1 MAG: hypothetical protein A2X97_11130 [Bdellovibrionales bacterium GWA1_52_35]OFZ41447.1 MAG: hypothetical protein A2070_01540 [Bdellovibrionales bacterium GWC1_52_8]HAR43767.1 hypothetical protein [Bdellovibrionales bacterium]HCM39213.1 hypothetical protein [Bdellovibrionales bacterium]
MEKINNTKIQGKFQKLSENNWSLLVGFLLVGPFVLPLVWMNSRFSKNVKWIASVVILVVSFFLLRVFSETVQQSYRQYEEIQQLYKQYE